MRKSHIGLMILFLLQLSCSKKEILNPIYEQSALEFLGELLLDKELLLKDSSLYENKDDLEAFLAPLILATQHYVQKESCGLSTIDWDVYWDITESEDSLDIILRQFESNYKKLRDSGNNPVELKPFKDIDVINNFDSFVEINKSNNTYIRVAKHIESQYYVLVDITVQTSIEVPTDEAYHFEIYLNKQREVLGWEYSGVSLFEPITCN